MARKLKQSVIDSIPHLRESLEEEENKESGKRRLKQSVYDEMPYLSGGIDADVAPLGGNRNSWFKSGGFSDGVDGVGDFFGDLGQTIGGTVGDLGLGILKGVGRLVEGVVDLGTYGVAGVADLIGKDDFAAKAKKTAQYSFVDDFAPIKTATDFVDRYSVLGDKADMVSEGLGQVGGIILTGGLGAAAGLGTGGVAALTTGITGLSSMGSGMGSAYEEGASDKDAFVYGLGAGAIEAGTELLFGGLGKGVKALGVSRGIGGLDDIFAKKLSSSITRAITNETVQKVAGNTIEAAVKAGGEGAEEVLSGIGSAVMKKLTYEDDESLGKLIEDENLLEQFVVGAITSSIAQGADFVKATSSGRDFVTGYTDNEQAVIDKVVEKRVAEREKDGGKLTTKEIGAIEEQVREDMEHGQLDIDTIEEVLGGEDYTAYRDTVKSEDELKAEYDALAGIKKSELTTKQEDRLAELKGMNLSDTSKRDGLRQKLDEAVRPQLEGSRLAETYRERERKGKAFEADLTKYKGRQREAVERAVKSGVLNNTYRSHELVDVLSKIEAEKGISFDYTNNAKLKESIFAVEGKTVNGFANKKTGAVTLNVQSPKAWQSVVGHEITHVLEGTESYSALQQAVYAYANSRGELETRRSALTELYSELGADVESELTADLVGDYLFTDKKFIDHLTGNRTLFQKVYDEIKYLWKVATGKERDSMERLVHEFDRAWKEISADSFKGKTDEFEFVNDPEAKEYSDDEVQYSIREGEPPKETGTAYKVFYVKDGKLYPPMVANPGGADTPMGVWLNADVGQEAPPSKTGRAQVKAGGKGTQGGSGSLAFRPGWHLGDLPRASQFDRLNPETGKKELFPENFVWAEVEYAKDVDYQEEAMSYGYTDNGKFRHAYAGLPKLPENGYYRYRTNPKPDTVPWVITGAMKVNRLLSDAEVNEILEANGVPAVHRQGGDVGLEKFGFGEEGKVQYSLSDSDGNQLSEEQQDFFKDSKVRDENGNLKVMYHGTPSGDFTVFRDGTYFTEHKWYADVYQNPGASSINSRKTVTNPKTYEVYLDIKKPFDISDPEARDIYINDYIKGGNATGINPYLSDAEYAKIQTIDWTEGEDLREFLIDNEYDYDGLVLDEGAVGGYGDEVKSRGTSYVIFSPEQVKEVGNKAPTDDPDIRFSLSKSVEETKDLVAVHNLNADKLLKSLALGGMPMPSIAIARAKDGFEEFGDISLVFSKETVDPEFMKSNKVYSGDAWTPTYPRVEYKVDEKVRKQVEKKIKSLVPYEIMSELGRVSLDSSNIEDTVNRFNGDMVEAYRNDSAMKYAYLKDAGSDISLPMKEAPLYQYGELSNEAVRYFAGKLVNGLQTVELYQNMSSGEMLQDKELKEAVADAQNYDVLRTFEPGSDEYIAYEQKPVFRADEVAFRDINNILAACRKLFTTGVQKTVDSGAAKGIIDEQTEQSEYEAWLREQFAGIVEKEGIRNNVDYFTPSGNRRSFEALHWENTLENVVRAMKETGEKGIGSFGGGNIFGASTKEFSSIEEVRKAKERLQNIPQEEYEKMKDEFLERFFDLASSLPENKGSFSAADDAANMLVEAVAKYKTKNGMANYIRRESQGWAKYSPEVVDELIDIVNDIRAMPTGYFEAKPQRAVGFDEVGVFVIPRNADVKLKQELLNRGYSIAEYDPDVEGDRQRVVNGFEQYKFSLSNVGEEDTAAGDYRTPFRELALVKDVAPVADNTPTASGNTPTVRGNTPTAGEAYPEDYAPMTEEDANSLQRDYFAGISDADVPPEMPAPYYGEDMETASPADPFENRDMEAVGSRSVKAYMYENPEVKPFFQQEAEVMLGDLYRSTKGERVVDAQTLYDTGGEAGAWGVKRNTAPDIAELKDRFGYTYDQIEAGIKAIIEDNGKENNACSKRIEFMLNDRLLYGYQDFDGGFDIPANREYINLVNEKGITEYNEEARKAFFENVERYIPPVEEDIAPVSPVASAAESIPKTIMEAGEQMPIDPAQKTANAAAEGTPKTRKQLHMGIMDDIKATFSGKGFDFDGVLAKAKNLSTFATVDNTPQRVMEKALGYKAGGVLADITVNKVAQNESEGIKWLNSFTDRRHGLLAQISKQYRIKPGSKESAAAQMYAEGFYVDEYNDIIKYGDDELALDFPDLGVQERIKGLAHDPRIRRIYDETLDAINASRERNAYPVIQRLDNYFLHFRAMDDTFSRLGLPFNPNDIRAKDLPTDLNGVTADLKPGQPYFASAMHRTGKRTSFDLLGGLERYLTAAKNQIYHIDDIQTLRALRNYMADTYGQANGLEGIDELTEEEVQERIDMVYNSHLSTFAKFLNEEANMLAGKTALIDRGLEGIIGRRGMTFLDTVNRQVGSNMVGFNISSSLTNFLPVAQTFAKTNKFDFTKAFAQTVSNKISSIFGKGDGFAENSPVMIRRKGADRFYRTPWQKAGDAGYVLMSAVDDISSELIARTKYNELTRKGMDEQTAHFETDKWVSRLMGDRSLGQQPQLYNSKTLGIFTKFQLEVRNQLDSQFYDTIQEAKVSAEDIENRLARNARIAAKVTATFAELAIVQHLYGKAFESVAGYNPAFDIISTLATVFGFDDEEDSEDTALDNIEQGFLAMLEDLPYTSTFTGGRIPISSALPVAELIKGVDQYGNEKSRLETLGEAAPYYVLPGGYGQIKKTAAGLGMFSDEHPVSGSYTDSGKLRFPVEDTPANRVQAAIFGQYASRNAREYFDNGYAPLAEKQIQEYADLELPIREYREIREGLSGLSKLEEKLDYIAGLELPVDKKNILANNVSTRKDPIDLTDYEDYGSLEEFDFASKNPEKYAFLQEGGVSYADYTASEDSKEAYNWAYKNPEGYAVSRAVTDDVIAYRQYAGELNDITADKDANGKTISGSRKEKVIQYINGLELDYYSKIILLKKEYPSEDAYNAEIIEYLNGREDISYSDMVTILTELGFRVTEDGQIYAD